MKRRRIGPFACPNIQLYPLNTKKKAANAHARYHQSKTRKCSGGHEKICNAEKRYGIKGYDC